MWECIYKDFAAEKGLLGYEGKEKDLIRGAVVLYVVVCADLMLLNIHTPKTTFPKVDVFAIVGVFVSFLSIVIAVVLSVKRESKREHRIGELKQFKKILENEKYQLLNDEDKKEFLSYDEKDKEQLSKSFFHKNANAAIVSGTIIFFTATMDTFSKFTDDWKIFFFRWVLFACITVCLLGFYLVFRKEKKPRLIRCEKICNMTKEIILFANSLDNSEEEPMHYISYTDNLIAFVKKIMKGLFKKIKWIFQKH